MKITAIIASIFITSILSPQQIGDGYATGISDSDFNQPLKSGVYEINSLGINPDQSYSWQHLFVMRHSNSPYNFQFQLTSSYTENDRVFFRKIANSSNQTWYELATRGTNNFSGNQIINGNVGIGTPNPETLLNINVGSGGTNGIAGLRIGGLTNYASLEFGIDGDYDGMIRSYGNNINYYAGHWKTKGEIASENHSHNWYTSKNGSSDWSTVKMILNENGNLGIGTTNPTSKLTVAGNIASREIKVTVDAGADFVFENDYNLPSLDSVDKFIKENKHLPEIASAEEMKKDGINLSEMNIKLLQKIEELTLYSIQQNKKIDVQAKEIESLKDLVLRVTRIEKELSQK